MQTRLPLCRGAFPLLIGALFAGAAHADGVGPTVGGFPVWATQNTSMTGLKMSLTDLAPADGKAPSLTFVSTPGSPGSGLPGTTDNGAGARWGMGYALEGASQVLASDGFNLPDTHLSSGNGVVDIAITQGDVFLKTQSRMGLQEQQGGALRLPADGAQAVVSKVQNFMLGAHTALTLSGTFTADLALNLPAFRAYKDEQIITAVNSFSPIGNLELGFKNGHAMANPVQAWLTTIAPINQPDMMKLLGNDVDKGIDWSKPQHFEMPFTVTLSNDSDEAREALFQLYIGANSFHEFGWKAAVVPEPATQALMLLGLSATGLAARRSGLRKQGSHQGQRPV